MRFAHPIAHLPQRLSHALTCDHTLRQARGLLQVVFRAGAHLADHELLGGALAHQDDQPGQEFIASIIEVVVLGQLGRHAQAAASGSSVNSRTLIGSPAIRVKSRPNGRTVFTRQPVQRAAARRSLGAS